MVRAIVATRTSAGILLRDHVFCPQVKVIKWRADLVEVVGNWVIEYEVKTSRKDFKKDTGNTASAPKQMREQYYGGLIKNGGDLGEWINSMRKRGTFFTVPHLFYYVCPDGLVSESELPNYAGLLVVGEDGRSVVCAKEAPVLHEPVIDAAASAAAQRWALRTMHDRYWYGMGIDEALHEIEKP